MENNFGFDKHLVYCPAYGYGYGYGYCYKPWPTTTSRRAVGVAGKVYPCKFCPKQFGNPRALGGHQNAHKKERRQSKQLNPPPLSSSAVLEMDYQQTHQGESSKQFIKSGKLGSPSSTSSSSCSRQLGWKEQLQLFEEAAAAASADDEAELISWSAGSSYAHPPPPPTSDDSNGSAADQTDYSLDLDLHL